MRTFFLIAIGVVAGASSVSARGPGAYVGVEGGILFPKDLNFEVDSDRVQTVPTGNGLLGQTVTTTLATFGSGFSADYKRGTDVDVIAGYRFGMFRVEGEVAYKRARIDELTASPTLVAAINTAPIAGVTADSFSFGNRTTVLSAMVNGLVEYEVSPGLSVYGGGGIGKARVKAFRDRDSAIAFQFIAGISKALSQSIDVGFKYRYFQTRDLRFDTAASFAGPGGSTSASSFSSEGRFRSHSALVGLTFNFGASAAPLISPPPVELAPPPPPPAPPATQTCPDGSVIEASAVCVVAPPPPPAVGPERG